MYLSLYDQEIYTLYQSRQKPNYAMLGQLYDHNYQLLGTLIAKLCDIDNDQIAKSKRSVPPLHLNVIKKYRYTSVIVLTHQLLIKQTKINQPDLKIKVYFDLQVCEALASCQKNISVNKNHPLRDDCSDLTLKWELNLFLKHWLQYCIMQDYQWQKS